jgi:hypothetical protein
MPYTIDKQRKKANVPSCTQLFAPIDRAKSGMPLLKARGNRALQMTFK